VLFVLFIGCFYLFLAILLFFFDLPNQCFSHIGKIFNSFYIGGNAFGILADQILPAGFEIADILAQ
jgi:hypothetical protein